MDKVSVLVVDDDREIVKGIEKLLMMEGYDVKRHITDWRPWSY
jgi:FixJ family two-component response regulator